MSKEESKQPQALTPEADAPNDAAPDDNQDLDFYIKTIEEMRRERDEFYDLLLRKQAEFENYRKRVAREREETRTAAWGEVLKEILAVVDACEKGVETLKENEAESTDAYLQGYQLLLKSLKGVLDRFGVEEVPGPGSTFDPTIHEAVIRETDQERRDGEILEEYRKGYTIKGRLLRPSQVKVSVRPQEEPSEK